MLRRYTLEFYTDSGKNKVTIRAGGDRDAIRQAKEWLSIPGRALVREPKILTRTATGITVWAGISYDREDLRYRPLD